mmetsp:Transcript_102243/g.286639  ORF Transcript_102243/g.286639 Transcript_102243/m.286639 type:complete len:143 (+) Transcript_102243:81-509(+)
MATESTDAKAMVAEAMTTNEELRKANDYLNKHRIIELMNDLCAAVCFHKPDDVCGFLLQELTQRENEGEEHSFFEDSEINAVFGLVDLMQTGVITGEEARGALLSIANSQKQKDTVETMSLPEELDATMFRQHAKEALRIVC